MSDLGPFSVEFGPWVGADLSLGKNGHSRDSSIHSPIISSYRVLWNLFVLRVRAFTPFSCYPLSMPAKPRWHADVARIRATVSSLSAPFLDRPAMERLFGVQSRQANNLMRGLGGYKVGPAVVIRREDLLLQLDRLAGPRGYAAEIRRKSHVVEELDGLRSARRPRRVPAPPRPGRSTSLPDGVRLSASGRMTIAFRSPEDLLGRILGLAQAASSNFAAFASALEYGPGADPAPAPEREPVEATGQERTQ